MASPHLGLGLAPPSADPSAPPPPRRAPRLAKRRHGAATSRSRAQPSTSASWNPFGGGADASGQDGTAGSGSVDGGGGSGFGVGQNEAFVFGSAPAVRQQSPQPPPASSNEAPFVFGSVRDSLPRFDEGTAAASKLDDKMGKLKLQSPGKCSVGVGKGVGQKDKSSVFGVTIPSLVSDSEANVLPEMLTQLNIGTGAPLRNASATGVPQTFVFGSSGAGTCTDSRSTASSCSDSHASSSVQVAEANGVPESGRADGINDVAPGGVNTTKFGADCGADDASVIQEKITQLNIGNGTFQYMKDGGSGTHQTQVFSFGGGGTAGTIFGHVSSNASEKGNVFFSPANTSSSNGAANLPPERTSNRNVAGGVTESMGSGNANCPPEAFVFGRNGSTNSASEHSAHGTSESTLLEKMTELNIQHRIPSQSMKGEAATQQPKPFIFGSKATSSSSVKTTSFTISQANVSSQTKDSARNLANDDTRDATHSKSNNDKGYVTSNFVIGSGSSAPARSLQDEIKKLNINREGPSVGCAKVNDASTPEFLFQSQAEATPGYGTVPQSKFQESCPFTPVNHSSSFSTSANEMPSFSSNLMNAGKGSAPGESNAVKHDPASCSRESLFGIDYIKSAYRDKKEAHKSTRKTKRPTRLKQHSQLHQVSQETCTNGLNSDLRGDYSPMDCSPYHEAVEQVSREASVGCDQAIHILDSSVSNKNTICAEDDLVSATGHLVIDADLPTCQDEGRDPIADASESKFGSNFSSFDEEINFRDVSQPLFTNMSVDVNGEPKMYTTEAWVDGFECNISGQTCKENTARTEQESGGSFNTQSSSEHLSGLNFTFGASQYPESSFSTQRRTTKRKLRTKGSQVSKPSATQASVQPKSSQDTKSMQFSPETSETENSVKEQLRRDASILADLETCETWRTSGNQAYANGHFATAEGCYTRGINSISQYGTSGRCSRALMLCYSNRAATRMSLGRMREALEDCLTATSIDPTFLKAKVRFANCQLALGDLEGASSIYRACLDSSNTADFNIKMSAEASYGLERVQRVADWISQSRELLKKRTLPEAKTALEYISSALEISSHSDNLMEMKAEALLTLRRYEEVIELCQKTVDLAERNAVVVNANGEPNNSSVSGKAEFSVTLWRPYLICKSYFLLGKLEEALDLLKRHELVAPVKESDGSTSRKCFSSLSTSIRQLLSFKAAGNELFQARRYSEAVEQYSAALACNSDSRPFSAVCFCNRAAAYQALGQLTDAIADCSLAMVLDANYPKAISRRATLYEMIRDYGQSANDLRKLIALIQRQANKPGVSPKVVNKHSDLKQARARLLSVEDEARKDTPLNLYLILGVEPSCAPPDIKKAYRKAALRHHPDKATQLLVRNENADDGFWRDVAKEVYSDADHLFKTIGEAYNILSDPDKREEYDIEENLRNAARRAFKGRSAHRSPEPHYTRQYDRGFSPRQWQSAGQSNKGAPRSRWSGYEYSDDYW